MVVRYQDKQFFMLLDLRGTERSLWKDLANTGRLQRQESTTQVFDVCCRITVKAKYLARNVHFI